MLSKFPTLLIRSRIFTLAFLFYLFIILMADKDYYVEKHSQRRAGRRSITCLMEMELR